MAQVSALKMKNLAVGVILAFLTTVHSTPVNTQILTKNESDIFHKAIKDEFLIPSQINQSPDKNTTVPASFHFKDNDMIESHPTEDDIDHSATTVPSVSHAQSSTSTVMTRDTDASTTQSPQSAEKTKMQRMFLDHHLGSGDGDMIGQYPSTSSSITSNLRTEGDTASLPSTAPSMFTEVDGSDLGSGISEEFSESTIDRDMVDHHPAISSRMTSNHRTEVNTVSSTSTAPSMFTEDDESDLGSGILEDSTIDRDMVDQHPAISSRLTSNLRTEVNTVSSTSTAPSMFTEDDESDLGSGILEDSTIDRDMVDQHPATSSSVTFGRGTEVTSTLPASTSPPMLTRSEGSELNYSTGILTSDLGSGDGVMLQQYPATSSSMTSSTSLSTPTASPESEGSESRPGIVEQLSEPVIANKQFNTFTNGDSSQDKGNSTPGWLMSLACVVGVAALVIVCIAFVTREKWMGPSQVPHLEINVNSSNQKEELEMETLLHKDRPRENQTSGEYTIIPLDTLPQGYTSY